jgi:subtilisin family serine protease
MPQFIVNVDRLNKRNAVPESFSDKSSVIGVVNSGFRFEGEEIVGVPNAAPGPWYKDRDGSVYWGGGLKLVPVVAAPFAQPPAVTPPQPPPSPPSPPPPSRKLILDGKETFQWLLDLGVHDIWNASAGVRGAGVKIAVLDSGYNTKYDDLAQAVKGVNVVGLNPPLDIGDIKSDKIDDSLGHGTYCGSILASRNAGDFILGIAPDSELLVVKISETGGFKANALDIVVAGIRWAVQHGADIISISYSFFPDEITPGKAYLDGIQQQLNEILDGKKVLIFAACGNNDDPDVIQRSEKYPASLSGCISIGATDNGKLSPITVRSKKTIIHAQGVGVSAFFKDAIRKDSGTSASTPIAAGVAALVVSRMKAKDPAGGWDPERVKALLEDGDPIQGDGPDDTRRKLLNPLKIFNQL